jgi:AAA15 family ATPase/GTPase
MLIEFSVGNFRSIKEIQTLSFVATAINEHEQTHTFEANPKMRLLKTIGIYGANASGKSNLIKAMWAMVKFMKSPFEDRKKFEEHIQPFKLNTSTQNEGSFFQLVFMIEEKIYRYGFVYLKGKIISEWLFGTAKKNEVEYFRRENSEITIKKDRFSEGIGLESKTREDNLFLNVVYEFNGRIASEIRGFLDKIIVIRGNDNIIESDLRSVAHEFLESDNKRNLIELLQLTDIDLLDLKLNENNNIEDSIKNWFGIQDLDELDKTDSIESFFQKVDTNKMFNDIRHKGNLDYGIFDNFIISQKNQYDEHGKYVGTVNFSFDDEASDGTKKMFNLSGIILNSFEKKELLVIDEFDSRFHTLLTKAIIKLYNSDKNKSAQLCFVTHDTNLLDKDLLRRDQIYFTEKNLKGETLVYSLSEIKGVRNDASFEKDYIKGKYGAIPFIQNLNNILQ